MTSDVLPASLAASKEIDNESDEATYLVDHVLVRLQMAGFLIQGSRTKAAGLEAEALEAHSPQQSRPVLGEADRFLIAGHSTVPIEFKATHNLLLPEQSAEVIRRFERAVNEVNETKESAIDWINVGKTLAQLINYMFLSKSRYGVLSSGTRSYCFKLEEDTNSYPKVFISNAWFIGQKNYLRAWSFLYQQAKDNGDFQYSGDLRKKWKASTPSGRRRDTDDRAGADACSNNVDGRDREVPANRRKHDDQDRDRSPKRRKIDGQ